MAVSKKIVKKKSMICRYSFGALLLIVGIILNITDIGQSEFFSYNSVGSYLIFVGILVLILATIILFRKKKKIVDERAEKIASKAMAWVWYSIFLGGFIVMILDGIFHFNVVLSSFVSYAICMILLVYVIAYKIIERKI